MKPVGVVAALAAEARTLGSATRRPDGLSHLGVGTLLAVSGIGCTAAAVAAQALIDAGARALMSFGLAGGLDPNLAAGSVVLPHAVISRDAILFPTAVDWRDNLSSALLSRRRPVAGGKLLTSPLAIDSTADKAAAFRETDAVAVDMESLAVAQVAAKHHVPFIAVRVIVDTAADALPRAVVAASHGGKLRIGPLLRGLAVAPADLVGMLRLLQRYRAALLSLAAVARDGRLAMTDSSVRVV